MHLMFRALQLFVKKWNKPLLQIKYEALRKLKFSGTFRTKFGKHNKLS